MHYFKVDQHWGMTSMRVKRGVGMWRGVILEKEGKRLEVENYYKEAGFGK